MIDEVINVSLSGDNLILNQVKKIASSLAKVRKQKPVDISPTIKMTAFDKFFQAMKRVQSVTQKLVKMGGGMQQPEQKEPKEKGKFAGATASVAQGLSSMDTATAATSGVSAAASLAGGPYAAAIAGITNAFISGANAFSSVVGGAIRSANDTLSHQSRIDRYTGERGSNFLAGNDKIVNNQAARKDISLSERGQLATQLGNNFGKLSADFKDFVREVVNTRGKDGASRNFEQASAVAQGNFAALGTNKGYFFQKIADSLANLPPEFKQKLLPQVYKAYGAKEEDFAREGAEGTRAALNAADLQERAHQISMATGENAANAQAVNSVMNSGQEALIRAMGEFITELRTMVKEYREHGLLGALTGAADRSVQRQERAATDARQNN